MGGVPTSSHSGGVTQSYLGYNTAGGTTEAIAAANGKQVWKPIVLATAAMVVSVDAYVKGNGANIAGFFPGIKTDNAGAPGNVVAYMAGETTTSLPLLSLGLSATARWVSLPAPTYLLAGTYWFGILVYGQLTLHYDAGGGDYTSTDANSWLNEGIVPTNSTRRYSIRANVLA